jgi:hypothetical protein
MPARRRAAPLLATTAAALLLSACAAPAHISVPWLHLNVGAAKPTPKPSPQAKAAPLPTPTGPQPSIEQFIPVAERFVEQHRGLSFKSHVPVTLLDDAAFRQRLLGKQSAADNQAITTTSRDLVALHLIDRTVDLSTASRDLLGAGVSGFYEPKTKSLVVRGVAATPYVRMVLVHELTHALQDQWFGIDRPELDRADDERSVAFQTVVEGDAVRIENEYHDSMSAEDQAEAAQEEAGQGGGIPGDVPRVLVQLIAFPYVIGPEFMSQLDRIGGQAKVDDAFLHPPVSTAEELDLTRYLEHDLPRTVARPRADGTVYDHGVLGEFGLVLLLENVAGMAQLQAAQNASLWGGDEYVAWTSGSTSCLRLAVLAHTSAEQGALESALQQYAAAAGATVAQSPGGPTTVTSCG